MTSATASEQSEAVVHYVPERIPERAPKVVGLTVLRGDLVVGPARCVETGVGYAITGFGVGGGSQAFTDGVRMVVVRRLDGGEHDLKVGHHLIQLRPE